MELHPGYSVFVDGRRTTVLKVLPDGFYDVDCVFHTSEPKWVKPCDWFTTFLILCKADDILERHERLYLQNSDR